ncbi:MAG TPA: hypothetical protein VFA55_01625, partial [Candidatus Kapabacteria bacterium]|nr:hypothetical protein [Candidatus Kapabacteria bacterium]
SSKYFKGENFRKVWKEYRFKHLHYSGNKVFQGNLYPLPSPKLKATWPDCYGCLFGFNEKERYRYYVRTTRFLHYRNFYIENKPRFIIAFGLGHRCEFLGIFDPACQCAHNFISLGKNDQIEICECSNIMIVPHFSKPSFPDSYVDLIVKELKNRDVQIP